ncbi:MAG: hypothetical protein AW07_01914 [Candidatus Accumulibacter sp. SK-11]|nr:MAG: hypothetical protein AW07_01914 [Candidatus Accumulibacter sp. SK-11]
MVVRLPAAPVRCRRSWHQARVLEPGCAGTGGMSCCRGFTPKCGEPGPCWLPTRSFFPARVAMEW